MQFILKVNYEGIDFKAALEDEVVEKVEELDADAVMCDLVTDDDAVAEFKEKFNEVFWKGVSTFIPKPMGYFGGRNRFTAFDEAMYAASNYFEKNADKLSVKVATEDGEYEIDGLKEAIIDELVRNNERDNVMDAETRGIWTATVAVPCLAKFVKRSGWHAALQDQDGKILDKFWLLPEPQKDENGRLKWNFLGREYKPIVWFDRFGVSAIKCWSLCEDNEDWKKFWFGENGAIDWKQLGMDRNTISYMSVVAPDNKLDLADARRFCPVHLDKNDTHEQMLAKVEQAVMEEIESKKNTSKLVARLRQSVIGKVS